jgi:hypothetical protein
MKKLLLALTLFATPAWAQTSQVDFRGYALGSSIDEFRARPTPPGWLGGTTQALCSDTDQSQGWLNPSPDMAQAGVVNCGFVQEIGGSTVRAGMPLTPLEHEATLEFGFHNGRLFRVETYMDSNVSAAILEALTAKFGTSTSTSVGRFQTQAGAVFPQNIEVWRRGGQTVTMTTPDLTTQRMSVIYLDEGVAAEVERLARAARNPAAIM